MKKSLKLVIYSFAIIAVVFLVASAIRDGIIKSRDIKISAVLNTPIPSEFFGDMPIDLAGIGDEEKYLTLTNGSFSKKYEYNAESAGKGGGELDIEISKEDIIYVDLNSDGYREAVFPVTANLSFWSAGDKYGDGNIYSREDQASRTKIVLLKNKKGKPEYATSLIVLPEPENNKSGDILSYNYHLSGGFVSLMPKGRDLYILYGKQNESYLSHYLYQDDNWVKINSSPYNPDAKFFIPK